MVVSVKAAQNIFKPQYEEQTLPEGSMQYLFEKAVNEYPLQIIRDNIKRITKIIGEDITLEGIGVFHNKLGPTNYEQIWNKTTIEKELLDELIVSSLELDNKFIPTSIMPYNDKTFITSKIEVIDLNQSRGETRSLSLIFKKDDLNFTSKVFNQINNAVEQIKTELENFLRLAPYN